MLQISLKTAFLISCSIAVSHAATTRPNILFIVADDLRADAIHALGNSSVETPNLDGLVEHGSTFTQVYTMGSSVPSVGASTRAVMLSGRSLFRFAGDVSEADDDMPLLPEVLRERGYTTFATGKWQNGREWFNRGFSHGDEIFFGDMGNHEGLEVHDYDPTGEYPAEASHQIKGYSSEAFAKAAIDFLQERPRGKPFFAYVSFTAPHDPRNPPSGYRTSLPPLPENFVAQHGFDNGSLDCRDEKLLASPRVATEVQRELASYYGMIAHLDEQIGSLIGTLESAGVLDNTIVVFTSDSGLAIGSHGLLGKQNLYEHSILVPLIMTGPGIPRNMEYVSICYQMDVFPTLCELTNSKVPESIEGQSLLPIINAKAGRLRTSIYSAYLDKQRSVRDYRFKLIYYPEMDKYQLFNLRNDPDEMVDLFQSGKHGREINRLRIQLAAWQSSLNDPLR